MSSKRFEGPVATTENFLELGYVSLEKVKRLSTTISNVKCINPFVSLQWHVLTAPAASIPVSFDENAVVAPPPPATGRAPPPPSPPPPPPPDLDQAIAEFWRDDYNRGRAISTNTQISLRPDGPGTYTLSVSAIGSCVGQNSSSTASLVVLCNRAPIPDATVAVLDDVTLRGELDDFTPGVASPPSPPTAPPAPAAAPPPGAAGGGTTPPCPGPEPIPPMGPIGIIPGGIMPGSMPNMAPV